MGALSERDAVYAGTFDPITRGHEYIVKTMAPLFNRFTIAVGMNPKKSPLFDEEERKEMIVERVHKLGLPNVVVDSYPHQLLVHYARSIGAGYIIRGIRWHQDFDDEFTNRHVNAGIDPGIVTIWVSPPLELAVVSSSIAKDVFSFPDGYEAARKYVAASVLRRMKRKFEENRNV